MQSSVPVSTVITSIFTTYRMFIVFGNIFLRYHGVKWQNISILNSMIDNASILQHYKKSMLFIKALPQTLPWIPEPSTVNNKLKRREGSGSTGTFFD